MSKKFVSDVFNVPELLETEGFRLRPLTPEDVHKDYDAVMTSKEYLRSRYGDPENIDEWPSDKMTLEENLQDLERHYAEFLAKEAFTYTVSALDESRCLGCLYIYPSEKAGFEAEVYMWVRVSELEKGLDEKLFSTVKEWLSNKWPFEKVAYPGREISREEWKKLESVKGNEENEV